MNSKTNAFYTSSYAKWDEQLLQGAIESLQTIEELWELAIQEGVGGGLTTPTSLPPPHHPLLIQPSDLDTISGVLQFLQRCVGSQLSAPPQEQEQEQ